MTYIILDSFLSSWTSCWSMYVYCVMEAINVALLISSRFVSSFSLYKITQSESVLEKIYMYMFYVIQTTTSTTTEDCEQHETPYRRLM